MSTNEAENNSSPSYRLYRKDAGYTTDETALNRLPASYRVRIFRPSLMHLKPPHLPWFPFAVWGLLATMRLLKRGQVCIYLVFDGPLLIHYSVVLPKYFRFPFMERDDLQIGPVWTSEDHRRRGVATGVHALIVESSPFTRYWYVVRASNHASQRFAEGNGFEPVGDAVRRPRLGLPLLGAFDRSEPAVSSGRPRWLDERKISTLRRFERHAQEAPLNVPLGAASVPLPLRAPYLAADAWLRVNAPGKSLLDLGCGEGQHTVAAANYARSTVGVDLSISALRKARRRLEEGPGARASYLLADCENLPFPNESFDIVVSMGLLSYLDLDRGVTEMGRVVVSSGSVLIIDTLGENPLLRGWRQIHVLGGARIPWEAAHIVKRKEIRELASRFRAGSVCYYDLFTLGVALAARAFGEGTIIRLLTELAQRADSWLLQFRPFQQLAFKFVCVLESPFQEDAQTPAPSEQSPPLYS